MLNRIVLCSPVVILVVREGKQKFSVHKDLLAIHSRCSRDCFNRADRIKDGESVEIRLPKCKASQLGGFILWAYKGEKLEGVCTDNNEVLWKFGDILRYPDYQNDCMDGLR
jgi:hypothetical protein